MNDAPPARPRDALQVEPLGSILERVRNQPPRRFLIRGLWAEGAYGVLSAEDKAGKSWMAMDLALSVTSGRSWMSHWPVDVTGPVVMFLGEGGENKAVRRLEAIAHHKGINLDHQPLHLAFRTPNLRDGGHLAVIAHHVTALQPALVVVDPLYLAAAGADGKDLYAMGAVLQGIQHVCEPRNAALLVTHHWNKGGAGNGFSRSTGVGPGAWGRTNVSVAVDGHDVDPHTRKSTAVLQMQFQGDEVAEPSAAFRREVWADDPDDLNSPLRYVIAPMGGGEVEDERRVRALQIIDQHPGIGTKALREQIGGKTEHVGSLLDAMAQAGLIVRRKEGRSTAHYLPGSAPIPGTVPGGNQ